MSKQLTTSLCAVRSVWYLCLMVCRLKYIFVRVTFCCFFLHYRYGIAVLLVEITCVDRLHSAIFISRSSKSRFLKYVFLKKVIAFNKVDIFCPWRNSLIEGVPPKQYLIRISFLNVDCQSTVSDA